MFKRKATQVLRSDFPHGSCIKTEKGYYYVNGKTIKPIKNTRVLKSWSFPLIINAHSSSLAGFTKSTPLGFRDGTLIRDISDGRMYLVSKRVLRHIVSPDALAMLGKSTKDAVWVAHDEVLIHEKGDDL
jgi:hypothetical protein